MSVTISVVIDVVLPVLDEAEALPVVLSAFPDGYAPIVVDNGSRDGSARVAAGLGARVVSESRRGFGAACWAGSSTRFSRGFRRRREVPSAGSETGAPGGAGGSELGGVPPADCGRDFRRNGCGSSLMRERKTT